MFKLAIFDHFCNSHLPIIDALWLSAPAHAGRPVGPRSFKLLLPFFTWAAIIHITASGLLAGRPPLAPDRAPAGTEETCRARIRQIIRLPAYSPT